MILNRNGSSHTLFRRNDVFSLFVFAWFRWCSQCVGDGDADQLRGDSNRSRLLRICKRGIRLSHCFASEQVGVKFMIGASSHPRMLSAHV